tara:strand:- start:370 stop:597 length:228 start_codon:yes stop_codon:yes gene_type:complete
MNSLILKIINELIAEQSKINVRGFKGMGTSQVFVDRKSTNLGKSSIQREIDNQEKEEEKIEKNLVNVSKAFSKNH